MKLSAAIRRVALVITALAAASAAFAQETRQALPGAEPPPARVADLAWLAGSWVGEGLYGPAREIYSPVMGGQIAGHFVQTKGDSVGFMEIMSIVEVNGSLEYRLKHFNADLTGWEEKNQIVRFPLVAAEGDAWYFNGLTIRKDGPDGMVAAVRIGNKDGTSREAVFRYRRER